MHRTYESASTWFADRGVPISPPTLRRMISQKRGPAHLKLDKRVLFAESDLEEFLRARHVGKRCPASYREYPTVEPRLDRAVDEAALWLRKTADAVRYGEASVKLVLHDRQVVRLERQMVEKVQQETVKS